MPKRENRGVEKKEEEFEQKLVDVARVTRVMAGGKRMKFRVCLAIGDKKGRVGMAVAKGIDVTKAISKAFIKAKKNVIKVRLVNETIPHAVRIKFKSAVVLLKPASKGTGIKAGGPVRILCELAGIPNITSKILGCNNKLNIVKATLIAFGSFKVSPKNANKTLAVKTAKETKMPEISVKTEEDIAEKKSLKDKFKDLLNIDK